jgi:hypothetical protein
LALFWLPLGAGNRCVRTSGRTYEGLVARHTQRPPQELYHSALEVRARGSRAVIEMTPVGRRDALSRGVVCEGAVGSRLLRHARLFRYEVRCWSDGEIGDVSEAVGGAHRLPTDASRAGQLLDLVARVPHATWGRDEQQLGEMWNSNSLVSWLLASSGHDLTKVAPPFAGRAPGWAAGLVLASRRPQPLRPISSFRRA